jgi:deoxyguanosine kinase
MESMTNQYHLPYRYICVEGNIGAGKTSLARLLSERFHARLLLEQFEENSFLPKFYQDPEKYAFPLELSFMAERYQQMKDAFSKEDIFNPLIISDYLFDKSLIFSKKTLSDDLLRLYSSLFRIMSSSLPKPDLLIYLYLNTSKLQHNIHKRGRSYEQTISEEYLRRIQESYLEYIRTIEDVRILIIDTNELDFVTNSQDLALLTGLLTANYSVGVHTLIPKPGAGLF